MAKQVQLRRGTTAELSSVTGAIGEVIVDTTKDTLTVHDGYTVGGTPLLKEDLGNLANNSIGLGKIATGTQGQILYYNASGQLVTLSPGTSGYVLKTNGAGANPSWGEGLPTQTSNSGKVLTTNGTSASWTTPSIVKVHYLTYSTRTQPGNSFTGATFNFGSFTPVNAATNGFIVHANIPGRHEGQNFNGAGIRFSGSSTYDYRELGMLYAGPGSYQTFNSFNFVISEGSIAQTTYTIQHYIYTANSNMNTYCVNSSDDGRLNQTVATCMIIEFKNP